MPVCRIVGTVGSAARDFCPWPRAPFPEILLDMKMDASAAQRNSNALERVPDYECLKLMASVPVGRIIYTRQAMPAVEPVNFALVGGDIVIRTDPGGKLAAATRQAVVAFETDDIDPVRQRGWSVTAIGHSRAVTDPDDVARLREIGIPTWAPGEREHFIRITPTILHGRRLAAG